MKAFLAACVALTLIAVCAAVVLRRQPVEKLASTRRVRVEQTSEPVHWDLI